MTPKHIWEICFIVGLPLNFVTGSVVRNRSLFPLDIVHYNDFHDRFEETSVAFPICSTNDANCIGGFPRLYHGIKTLLRQKPNALLLNAGDVFQGTYWFTLLKWNVTQYFINMLPHDAHTLGNHEFDIGIKGLAQYLAALRAPVVVANIDTSQEPSLKGLYRPRVVVERSGRKIGIIGVIAQETQGFTKTGKVIFMDPIKAVKEQAEGLTEEGINIIIVLSHCGIEQDLEIAKEAGKYVDIIVGGHSHSLLWNEDQAPSKEKVVGPYPVIVESDNKRGHFVLIVTASAYSKYLGNITAHFNDEGDLVSLNGNPVFLDRSIPEDPEIKALMQPYTEKFHNLVKEVVGYTEINLDVKPCGGSECIIGDLIADSMLDDAKKQVNSKLPAVAFLTRNMIKGSISKGDITRGAIISSPFGNQIVTYRIKGKYLKEAMNFCLTKVWQKNPFAGPFMPQVAGMKVVLNVTSQNVTSIMVKNGEAYQPLRENQDYQLTTPGFFVSTGNLFKMLTDNSRNKKTIGVDFKIFEKYVRKISPILRQLDNRLIVNT